MITMKKIFYFLLIAPSFLFSQANQLYILNRGDDNIVAVPLNDFTEIPVEKFHDRIVASFDMVLDSTTNKLYWTSRFPEEIRVASVGSDTSSLLTNNTQGAVDLEIDQLHQKMYFADHGRGKIVRMNLDGSNVEEVTHGQLTDLTSVAVFPSHDLMFFADLDSAAIWKSDLNDENRVAIVDDEFGESYPIRVAVDTIHMKLYWSDDFRNSIQRVNFDGSEREIFYQGDTQELIWGLHLDLPHDHLYWTDYGKNQVGRAVISTLEAEPIVTQGLNDPNAVVLVHDPLNANVDGQVNKISLAPNPANDFVIIPTGLKPLDLYDFQGKRMNLIEKDNSILLSNLHAGAYVIRFLDQVENKIYVGKVVVQR
jgi:hypothetical protein